MPNVSVPELQFTSPPFLSTSLPRYFSSPPQFRLFEWLGFDSRLCDCAISDCCDLVYVRVVFANPLIHRLRFCFDSI